MINKTVSPGSTEFGKVYVTIKFQGSRLSITGVEGPKRNGDCNGSCGQITDALSKLTTIDPAWSMGQIVRLRDAWDRWHLNDMQAGCEHQRADGWSAKDSVGKVCAVCGYRFGSSWLKELVPEEVIAFLESLPDSGTDDWGRTS